MIFKTQDLWLAVALDTRGWQLEKLEKADGHRVNFVFHGDDTIREDVEAFFSGDLQSPVIEVMLSLKKLKTRITGLSRASYEQS